MKLVKEHEEKVTADHLPKANENLQQTEADGTFRTPQKRERRQSDQCREKNANVTSVKMAVE